MLTLIQRSRALFAALPAYQASDLLLESLRSELKDRPLGEILNDPRADEWGYPPFFKTNVTLAFLGLDAYLCWWRGYIPYNILMLTLGALGSVIKKPKNNLSQHVLAESLPFIIWVGGLTLSGTTGALTAVTSFLALRLLLWPEYFLPLALITSSKLLLSGASTVLPALATYGLLQAPPLILQQMVKKLLPLALFVMGLNQFENISFFPATAVYFLMRRNLLPSDYLPALLIDTALNLWDHPDAMLATVACSLFQASNYLSARTQEMFKGTEVTTFNHITQKQILYLLMPWVLSSMLSPVAHYFSPDLASDPISSATKYLQLTAGPVDWSTHVPMQENNISEESYFSRLSRNIF